MNSIQNISELVSLDPSHCSDHMPPCIIEDELDNMDQAIVDNSIS